MATRSKPSPEVAAALRKHPKSIKMSLEMSSGGDWDRVTFDGHGFVVHNNPQLAKERAATPAPRPSKPLDEPKPVAVTPRPGPPTHRALRTRVEPEALALIAGRPVEIPTPPPATVTVVSAPAAARPPEELKSPQPAEEVVRSFDWASVDLEPISVRFHTRFRQGIPEAIQFTYHPDVLALYGMDFDRCDDAVRHPERVEIRSETFDKEKRYPILGFYRGDVLVIIGFRDPPNPKIIAAYNIGLLLHDTHRVNHVGGGGAKKTAGLPTTPKAAIKYLRILNCQVADLELGSTAKAVEVTYQKESLGKITVGDRVSKAQVETDYQRCLRRKHAIDRRLGVTA